MIGWRVAARRWSNGIFHEVVVVLKFTGLQEPLQCSNAGHWLSAKLMAFSGFLLLFSPCFG
jgi:hypothetical protein